MAYHFVLEPRPFGRAIEEAELLALGLRRVSGDNWVGLECEGQDPFVIFNVGGAWFAPRLSDHQIMKFVEIAGAVSGVIVGDDGETYSITDGNLTVQKLRSTVRSQRLRRFEDWLVQTVVLVIAVLLAAAAFQILY